MTRRTLFKKARALVGLLSITLASHVMAQSAHIPNPTVNEIALGSTIKVSRLPDNVYLRDVNDPDDIIWARIPTYRVALTPAPGVHASTQLRYDPQKSGFVYFQLARTSDRFYVRMRWPDTTESRENAVDKFGDGAAIQFALNGVNTSFMMGTAPDYPVNIWYWRADRDDVENVAAAGFGSTTILPDQTVTGKAAYHADDQNRNQHWHLVMSRELNVTGEHQIGLQTGTVPMAFALWQGADGQRDGNKLITMGWVMVDVEPEH